MSMEPTYIYEISRVLVSTRTPFNFPLLPILVIAEPPKKSKVWMRVGDNSLELECRMIQTDDLEEDYRGRGSSGFR